MKIYIKPFARFVLLSTEAVMIEVSGYDTEDSRNARKKEIDTESSIWRWQDDTK